MPSHKQSMFPWAEAQRPTRQHNCVVQRAPIYLNKAGEGFVDPSLPVGVKWDFETTFPTPLPDAFLPIEAAEGIVKGYRDGPAIEHGGSQAFYRPSTDIIHMPEPTRFSTNEEYYATRFHEAAHSTGHSKRLNRKLDTDPKPFGSPDYGREESVAEMAAAFLCAHAGISPVVTESSTAYISGWLGKLKQDKKLIVTGAGQAQKAADWILGTWLDASEADQDAPESGAVAPGDNLSVAQQPPDPLACFRR